jgi:dihydrofolate reductase
VFDLYLYFYETFLAEETIMRKLISGIKISIDGKMESSEGYADWVEAWSEDYGLAKQIDTCVLGGAMYPGYEGYWSAIAAAPKELHPMTGKLPTQGELDWSRFAAKTPHYVLSNKLTSANWPQTKFIKSLEEIKSLKQQKGKNIYLMGGAQITANAINAELLDEIHLIVYPLLVGAGKELFANILHRRQLTLLDIKKLDNGLVSLNYAINHSKPR